jgi:hypothetical protein
MLRFFEFSTFYSEALDIWIGCYFKIVLRQIIVFHLMISCLVFSAQ